MSNCEKQDCHTDGVEEYCDKRYREECWKFWEDEERVSSTGWMMGMAIILYEQNHPERREGFKQEYLKISEKSA